MMNFKPNRFPCKMQGFSLIEFLVASLLSMIVLMAVGSSYFTARRLSDVALARLNVQQDLRNTSNMIVRDARMAGSFGCFNMSNPGVTIASDGNDAQPLLKLKQVPAGSNTAVKMVDTSSFINLNGFVPTSAEGLMFQYGTGSATVTATNSGDTATLHIPANDPLGHLNSQMPIVISSCNVLDRPSSFAYSSGNLTNITPSLSTAQVPQEISVLRYNANIYLVGHPEGSSINGLYRFQLGDQGQWVGPQLLMNHIDSMDVRFTYVDNCPKSSDDKAEGFRISNSLDVSANASTPAQVRIILNGNSMDVEGKIGDVGDRSAGTVNIYNIDATIRGGNTCADRSI